MTKKTALLFVARNTNEGVRLFQLQELLGGEDEERVAGGAAAEDVLRLLPEGGGGDHRCPPDGRVYMTIYK